MASVWLYVWTDVRLDRGILCALWAIRQFYIDASFIVIILWIRGIYKWYFLREKWMIYSPVVAFVLVIHMLMSLINHDPVTVLWYLYFGLSFVVMMIIPGHILNNKAKKQCLKN